MAKKASEIIVICEDKMHEVFARRFLKRWGVKRRTVRVREYPHGAGSGEGAVFEQYPKELRAYRSRSSHAATILIAVVDADAGSVDEHHREFDAAARESGINARKSHELVVHVIPKWHIETWLAWIDGRNAVENIRSAADEYKDRYGFRNRERDAHALIDDLADWCKQRADINPPPSLCDACEEFGRIRESL